MSTRLDRCGEGDEFPFKSKLSFTNLIGYWQVRTNDKNSFIAATAKEIVKQVNNAPELLQPIEDTKILDKHKNTIDLLMTAIFSPYIEEEEMMAVMTPFKKESIHVTKSYQTIIDMVESYEALFDFVENEEILVSKTLAAYSAIMQMYYGTSIAINKHMVYTLQDAQSGLKRHFRININPKFCEIVLNGELPKLNANDIKYLTSNINNLDVWKEMLPTEIFEFQGLIIFTMTEVTKEQVLSNIKEDLLEKGSIINEDSFREMELKFRSLLQISDLKLGIAGYQKSKNTFINFGGQVRRSILLGNATQLECHRTSGSLYERFVNLQEPMIIEDMSNCCNELEVFGANLVGGGVQNIALSPLFYNDEFVGLLELASPNVGDIDALTINQIKEVLPLFAIAVKRNSDELDSNIEKIIKEKYTSIHPTVEWSFNNAAHTILEQIQRNESPIAPQIIFKDVYPLYAASDIRNSSVERNKAIHKDLKHQIQLALEVLGQAMKLMNLPIIDETIYRLDKFRKKIKNRLVSGDEASILEFIKAEVEPTIKNIETNNLEVKKISLSYWDALDSNFGVIYQHRKNFEDSLTQINDTIGMVLDEEEKKAQKMFPHFFEKYKTDGVEHNIYIGESLVENLSFDPIYLRNLRLWQLLVTAEIASKTTSLIPDLPLPLETTHLILVHSSPLSIRFRQDEKKFDVDGAYNIRYEITKKRIDKALVQNTEERLTQPGKIAIIYAQEKDAEDYMKHIEYLRSKGILDGEVEHLDIEDLQGVSGLKALRVSVNLNASSIMKEVKEIMQVAY